MFTRFSTRHKTLAISTFSLVTTVVFAVPSIHEERTVKSTKDIIPYVEKMAQNYGNDNVCIIYDIDNTLITNSGKYASESWGTGKKIKARTMPANYWAIIMPIYMTI